jgi:hypothetical protein
LLDNDWPSGDDVYLKNYTSTIYVDGANLTPPWSGTPANPYLTVSQAYNVAWDGARLCIYAGWYAEALTMSKRIGLTAEGGIASIGQ